MAFTRLALACFVLALPFNTAMGAADARTISAEYLVKIRGFLVGRAAFQGEISGKQYTLQFSGGVGGLARIFSDAETTATVSGGLGGDRLLPSSYDHAWTEDGETETVTMRFSGRGVTEIDLEPPRKNPERYVPFTQESNAAALDLVSAFLWPVKRMGDAVCDRTLPLVDGRRRFDIALSFVRFDNFITRDQSFASPVAVCTFRYVPVAGQRIDKPDNSILNADDTEVWMAPVGEGYAVPARIQLRSRVGKILFEATSIAAD